MPKKNDPAVERREAALDAIQSAQRVLDAAREWGKVMRLAAANERLAATRTDDEDEDQQR